MTSLCPTSIRLHSSSAFDTATRFGGVGSRPSAAKMAFGRVQPGRCSRAARMSRCNFPLRLTWRLTTFFYEYC
jgi:hypothetical protein